MNGKNPIQIHSFSTDSIVLLCWVALIIECAVQAPVFTTNSYWFFFLLGLESEEMCCLTITY